MDMAMQPQMTGLESLGNFQDNMNSTSGLERLRALQTLGLMSLANDTYMQDEQEEQMPMTGIQNLPQIQMGFGGFLKNVFKAVTKPFKAVAKGIGKFAKSKIGRMVIPAALGFAAPWALGLKFATAPIAYSAMAGLGTGLGSLATGAKPGDALKQAVLAGALSFGAGKLFQNLAPAAKTGQQLSGGLGNVGQNVGANVGKSVAGGSGLVDSTVGFGLGAAGTTPTAATGVAGLVDKGVGFGLGASPNVIPTGTIAAEELARQTTANVLTGGGQQVAPVLGTQPGAPSLFSGDFTMDALKNLPKQAISYGKEALKQPETYAGFGRDLLTHPVDAARARERANEQQKAMLDNEGFTEVFDTGTYYYVHPQTKQKLSLADAMSYMSGATAPFTGSQRLAQAETSGFGSMVPQLVLSQSGGLIGRAYGGGMQEFSGMVEGDGGGMEDNVYMPIVEDGQQKATLAVSPKEYVVDANTMSLLGNGNPDEGAKVMDETIKDVRMAATGQKKQQNEIDGLASLDRMRRSI